MMTAPDPMTDAELAAIQERSDAATAGPWFVRDLDDDKAMSLVAISTVEDTGLGERWPSFDHGQIIAATLVQSPRYVDIDDERWDENARFLAHARQDIPRLIAEIRRLRHLLAASDHETG
jgi:hypothetical protein